MAVPERRCIVCRQTEEKHRLQRFVLCDGKVCLDQKGNQPGRGAYVHASEACQKKVADRKLWAFAFRKKVHEVEPPIGCLDYELNKTKARTGLKG